MNEDRTGIFEGLSQAITTARPAYFLFARPTENPDELPATIGERDVFFDVDQAMDALDLHYAWSHARHGEHSSVVSSAQWYLQSAMVGPRVEPGLGEVYLATKPSDFSQPQAVAGGFLTEGELIHWTPFVRAVKQHMPIAPASNSFALAYRTNTTVSFDQVWFTPLESRRVYPQPIVVGEDDL
ncbi:hypothetical protein AAFP30_07465 [Gordonia sp. CPCC 205515]|uniref:hypothetical protein n=1 Tax=Gordonia sp. CPCC 205515 TaxID=3140791 RepID=UPI003AF372AF